MVRFGPETVPSVIKIAIEKSWCLHLGPVYQGDRTSVEKNGLVIVEDGWMMAYPSSSLSENAVGLVFYSLQRRTSP